MIAIKTKNGGYLVKVNDIYGCYTDKDGSFLRSVRDGIQNEMEWAKDNWNNYEEEEFPKEKKELLLKELTHIQDYKDSLVNA